MMEEQMCKAHAERLADARIQRMICKAKEQAETAIAFLALNRDLTLSGFYKDTEDRAAYR